MSSNKWEHSAPITSSFLFFTRHYGADSKLHTVGSPHVKAAERKDEIAIPEVAIRPSMENENFHTGRGGTGNVHIAAGASKHPVGLADKLKNKLFKKKAEKESAAA